MGLGVSGGDDRLGVAVSERLGKSLADKALEYRRVNGGHLGYGWRGYLECAKVSKSATVRECDHARDTCNQVLDSWTNKKCAGDLQGGKDICAIAGSFDDSEVVKQTRYMD